VWVLTLDGRAIRTTGEHPFYAEGHGWKPLAELAVGDRLLGESGDWLTIEALEDTGTYETVYNLRVSSFHTYFVGEPTWGFSVWAHNVYTNGLTPEEVIRTLVEDHQVDPLVAARIAHLGDEPGVRGNQLIAEVLQRIQNAEGASRMPLFPGHVGREEAARIATPELMADLRARHGGDVDIPGVGRVPRPSLPAYNGHTGGVLIPIDANGQTGNPVPFTSNGGTRQPRYPYSLIDGHGETQSALHMEVQNIPQGVFFHNHPNGTCSGCLRWLHAFLQEGSILTVVPLSTSTPHPTAQAGHLRSQVPTRHVGSSDTPL
jgi:hypothetical protein